MICTTCYIPASAETNTKHAYSINFCVPVNCHSLYSSNHFGISASDSVSNFSTKSCNFNIRGCQRSLLRKSDLLMLYIIRIFKDNGVLIILQVRIIFTFFSHKSQMDHTCKLGSKCLKEDESLERCNIAVCQNVIHLGCFKKLVATSGENEWEGPLFCGKCCFKDHKKALDAAASKAKGRVPWHSNGPTPKINSMEVMIDWFTTSETQQPAIVHHILNQ